MTGGLVSGRVGDAREAQGETRVQFKSALERFIALTGTGGGALQEKYDKLSAAERRYQALIGVMKQAAVRMDPVLAKFEDQVLFLKHNLNAQVVTRLGSTNALLQSDISQLILEMERSIQEADAFIKEMKPAAES